MDKQLLPTTTQEDQEDQEDQAPNPEGSEGSKGLSELSELSEFAHLVMIPEDTIPVAADYFALASDTPKQVIEGTIAGRPKEYTATPEEHLEADFNALARTNALISLPEEASEGDVIELVSRGIPINDYGLPIYYIRSDLLPSFAKGTLTQQEVDSAAQDIYFHEGFPTLADGRTFWSQLPHEPYPSYTLFQKWLELGEIEGIRILEDLARREHLELRDVVNQAKQFYWSARARAYDVFIVAAEQKRREHRIRRTENKHYNIAEDILSQLYAKTNDPEWIDNLEPAEAVRLMAEMVKIQRQSLGLNQNSAQPSPNAPGSSQELIFRQIAQQSAGGSGEESNTLHMLHELLQDPKMGFQAQELILKVNR